MKIRDLKHMHMKKIIPILFVSITTLVSLMLSACSNPITEQLAYPSTQGKKGIEIVSLQAQQRGSVLTVQAEIANSNKKNARVFYRFRWLDGEGNILEANEQWKPLLIYGKQSAFVTDVAPHPDAADYRLEFNIEYPAR